MSADATEPQDSTTPIQTGGSPETSAGSAPPGPSDVSTEASATPPVQQEVSWLEQHVPKTLKDRGRLHDFKGVEDLAKAYLDLHGKAHAAPEQPEGYQFDLPAELPIDEGFVTAFKQWAHEGGLSNEQAGAIAAKYSTFLQGELAKLEQTRQETVNGLKKEWGALYDQNLGRVQKLFGKFGGPDSTEFLEKTGLGDHPVMVKMFYEISKVMSDHYFVDTQTGGAGAKNVRLTPGGEPMLSFPSMEKKG